MAAMAMNVWWRCIQVGCWLWVSGAEGVRGRHAGAAFPGRGKGGRQQPSRETVQVLRWRSTARMKSRSPVRTRGASGAAFLGSERAEHLTHLAVEFEEDEAVPGGGRNRSPPGLSRTGQCPGCAPGSRRSGTGDSRTASTRNVSKAQPPTTAKTEQQHAATTGAADATAIPVAPKPSRTLNNARGENKPSRNNAGFRREPPCRLPDRWPDALPTPRACECA